MQEKLNKLKILLNEVCRLNSVQSLLAWDQMVNMPEKGSSSRGKQLALISLLSHDKFINPEIGKLLDSLMKGIDSFPDDSDDAALIMVAKREYDKEIKVPASFVSEMTIHATKCYESWVNAREQNSFSIVKEDLRKTVELSRKYADFFPGYKHIADPLINDNDYGMSVETLQPIFKHLRDKLVPLVKKINSNTHQLQYSFLSDKYPIPKQKEFNLDVIKQIGFDFSSGRFDKSLHPFTTSFAINDVRITTRYSENEFTQALFGSIHETGHALYEQGIKKEYDGTFLSHGTSSGVHESQSRLWENLVGRSKQFWKYFLPKLQSYFPPQLKNVSLEEFYKGINRVKQSLIRVEADEVTYNLHIIIRFNIELLLLEGKLSIDDLPDYWDSCYVSDLGIRPTNDRTGVLQDIHWYDGMVGGGFQGYTIGNILSAQFYNTAIKNNPSIENNIANGEFSVLHKWLVNNIYQYGKKYTTHELVKKVTGTIISIEPYVNYLENKFNEIYR